MSKNTLPAVIPPAYEAESAKEARATSRIAATPRRAPDFITQLFVQTDAHLRQKIGCRYMVEQRMQAYGAVLANRPSVQQDALLASTLDASS